MTSKRASLMHDEVRGLQCPRCGCGHFRVIYTRRAWGRTIRRRRECHCCGRRITTWEKQTL